MVNCFYIFYEMVVLITVMGISKKHWPRYPQIFVLQAAVVQLFPKSKRSNFESTYVGLFLISLEA